MPNSETLENIQIPYPTEGVIRSAAIDDVSTPEDSVQSGININFDKIGAWQTRLGLTKYADDLIGQIRNFGTLNNSTISSGYDNIQKLNPSDAFTPTIATDITAAKVDATHALIIWTGVSNYGYAQVVSINATTGDITPVGTPLTFYNFESENYNRCIQIGTTNHYLNIWSTGIFAGLAQVLTVNLSTFAVTAEGSPFTITAGGAYNPTINQIDSSHFIIFFTNGGHGVAEVLAVNLSTFAVTLPGSLLTFDGSTGENSSSASLGDGIHFINFWSGTGFSGKAQVFSVNTSTWVITAVGTVLTFGTFVLSNSCSALGDGQHFINFWDNGSATLPSGSTQVFNVNLSTFAVTALDSSVYFGNTGGIQYNACVAVGDGEHFVNFWEGVNNEGFSQVFDVNLTTFVVLPKNQPISYGIGSNNLYNAPILMNTYEVANFWQFSDTTGVGAVFNLLSNPIFHNYLYAQQNNGDVLNWNGSIWTTQRSSLLTLSKARFTQYLNYIWMVNGNSAIGNSVQTSNGGAFGTTLVPADFPTGDYIQAGFEGRVWVADSFTDAVYYTDIVQFTPPSTYVLTYDPIVNYIKNFSPQNGQTITGLFVTPRALLLFKQDSIYRIYGATSADSYPAYNVGTYSQESIVQAKDGIYFHHSSGFYKFSYDTQPVEISRRVIDFIQAIPRSNYEEIQGIYDGYDAVEWAVGALTVEGVSYTNCVMRYTISTQVWTIYDYPGNYVTAFTQFDDGVNLNMIMGTSDGKVNAMDSGLDDLGVSIYFEMIDRWRSFTAMYAKSKAISGMNIYTENGGGAIVAYQTEKTPSNVWENIGTINDEYDALFPNALTKDFSSVRIRVYGNNSGTPILCHGMEILKINDRGFNEN